MGITVTTNLGLIKPDGSESIQENLPTFNGWAKQNSDNCDVLDGLFRSTTHTYTPTWTASTLNPAIGAGGSITGKYIRLFPRLVLVHILLNVGAAGFSTGTGTYFISLPTGVPTEFPTFSDLIPLGKAALVDSSAVLTSTALVPSYNVGSGTMFFKAPNASTWTDSAPFTLGQNDRLSAYFLYPTDDA